MMFLPGTATVVNLASLQRKMQAHQELLRRRIKTAWGSETGRGLVLNNQSFKFHFHLNCLRFSLYQQKYRFLEKNMGYLLLDTNERVRLYSLFSVAPSLLTEVEGQHPAQDETVDRVEERQGGVMVMLEEQGQNEGLDELLRVNRAMLVRERELVQIQEAERLHLRNEMVLGQLPPAQEVREGVVPPPAVPPLPPAGIFLGAQRQLLGLQGAGRDGAGAGAQAGRFVVAGAQGAGAEVAGEGNVAPVPRIREQVEGERGHVVDAVPQAAEGERLAAAAMAVVNREVEEDRRERRLRMMRSVKEWFCILERRL